MRWRVQALLPPLAAALALLVVASALVLTSRPGHGTPLWPGAHFTDADRDRAIERGMFFLYGLARDPRHFRDWGHDMVGMFGNIAATASNSRLQRIAWEMGRERAVEWRRLNPHVPPGASADEVGNLVSGSDAAERLGVPGAGLWKELRQAAARFRAVDYYRFDPAIEAPPSDVPDACPKCGKYNDRGVRVCLRCGAALKMVSRYELWQDAMIGTFTGDRYGIALGAGYADVVKWLPQMRPYRGREHDTNPDYYQTIYAITHLIYTLNGYSAYQLSPACLPQEAAYLHANLDESIDLHDPETVGEFLDSLRSLHYTLRDPVVQRGFEYLLARQNPDGSWDDMTWPDVYGRYHPTWTAIDGLREYNWTRTLPCPAP